MTAVVEHGGGRGEEVNDPDLAAYIFDVFWKLKMELS